MRVHIITANNHAQIGNEHVLEQRIVRATNTDDDRAHLASTDDRRCQRRIIIGTEHCRIIEKKAHQ